MHHDASACGERFNFDPLHDPGPPGSIFLFNLTARLLAGLCEHNQNHDVQRLVAHDDDGIARDSVPS
eukprot:CAMPEP_0195027070 /NCGR_PEP_ID=MMETSP0326_2-20130528/51609_1 /TAXON_ID=2866 ORGANISM="Crypthecodinium cohnii, Strain Seligo" /NCGR_SAMPLE_ID=MMETSP0326_2 /ASSEMBLY_ACC=CAM_ASM_000348 /LENGTH=66 /DNA_ID=CAMNT_0040049159 /DNA_START=1 /DNA_END=198 /DNA_ORIENTATION=+